MRQSSDILGIYQLNETIHRNCRERKDRICVILTLPTIIRYIHKTSVVERLNKVGGVSILGNLCIAWPKNRTGRQIKFPNRHIIVLQCLKSVNDSPCHHCVEIILRAFDVEVGIFEKRDAILNIFLCIVSFN